MSRIIERPEHDEADFIGTFLLISVRKSGRSGTKILELTDHSATLEAFCLPYEKVPAPQVWNPVCCPTRVERNRDFRPFLKVEQLKTATAQLSLALQPNVAFCPAPQSLHRLVNAVDEDITHLHCAGLSTVHSPALIRR